VINIPKNYQEEEQTNDYIIRRLAVDFGIPLITNIQLAQQFVETIATKKFSDLEMKSWSYYQPHSLTFDQTHSSNRYFSPVP
jgi:carbamoyl-phosphate synthase large subunit